MQEAGAAASMKRAHHAKGAGTAETRLARAVVKRRQLLLFSAAICKNQSTFPTVIAA